MKEKLKIKEIIGIGVIGVILLVVLCAIIIFVSGTIMLVFGMKYDSIWSVIKFFIVYFVISVPIELILINGTLEIVRKIPNINDVQYNIIHFVLEVPIQMITIGIVLSFIDGIYMSTIGVTLFSIADHIISKFLENKADEIEEREETERIEEE